MIFRSELYAKPQEVIRCEKKNPRTGNVLKSFCEKHCPERKNGCKPGFHHGEHRGRRE